MRTEIKYIRMDKHLQREVKKKFSVPHNFLIRLHRIRHVSACLHQAVFTPGTQEYTNEFTCSYTHHAWRSRAVITRWTAKYATKWFRTQVLVSQTNLIVYRT